MNILVTADKNWAIGNQGPLLVSIPEDQRLLREETLGGIVVMGRKPGQRNSVERPELQGKGRSRLPFCGRDV